MIMTLRTQLTAVLLLVAVFLAPLNSFAAEGIPAIQSACDCHLLPADCGTERGDLPDHKPANTTDDCCDCEEAAADAGELQLVRDMKVNISARQLSRPKTTGHTPTVYLTIFVPPESCSRA